MRLRAKVDTNQRQIVEAFRKIGFAVIHLHMVGRGVPDLLLSNPSDIWLVEIKSPKNKKGDPESLTTDQIKFHQEWRGKPIIIGTSFEEIYEKIKST